MSFPRVLIGLKDPTATAYDKGLATIISGLRLSPHSVFFPAAGSDTGGTDGGLFGGGGTETGTTGSVSVPSRLYFRVHEF